MTRCDARQERRRAFISVSTISQRCVMLFASRDALIDTQSIVSIQAEGNLKDDDVNDLQRALTVTVNSHNGR
jgi:hypothetical protein